MPCGWVQVCPRAELPQFNSSSVVSRPLEGDVIDPANVWAISCFFVSSAKRGHGLSHVLVRAAIAHAQENGAACIDACPIDQTKQSKSVGLYVGSTRIFKATGFQEVALRKDGRPLMRLHLS